jgi:putative methyltransferase (TIGR04325 family)
MCFAYVLGLASSGRSDLSILDWGGGLGQYGLIAQGLYPELAIDYHCRDLSLMVKAGQELMPGASFYAEDAVAFARTYDLVMASSSLQYVEDWRETTRILASATKHYLFVTRQPFVDRADSFVVVQRPIAHGYDTEYPGWALNRHAFVEAALSHGLRLRRQFLTGEQPPVPGAPEQPVYRGFLFERSPT